VILIAAAFASLIGSGIALALAGIEEKGGEI